MMIGSKVCCDEFPCSCSLGTSVKKEVMIGSCSSSASESSLSCVLRFVTGSFDAGSIGGVRCVVSNSAVVVSIDDVSVDGCR